MKHLIIVGVGGFARELYWTAQRAVGYSTEWDIKGCLDGDIRLAEEEYQKLSVPLLGNINDYWIEEDDVFTCAIADSKARERIVALLRRRGAEFVSIICETAIIHGTAEIGKGVILGPNVVIGDHASVGDFSFLNTNSACGHDAVIEDYVSIMSYCDITGYSHLMKGAYMGSGARLLPHAVVGEHAVVGAGSVVLRRVKPNTTVYGNPAKIL